MLSRLKYCFQSSARWYVLLRPRPRPLLTFKIVEALVNDQVQLTSDEWRGLFIIQGDNVDSKWMQSLARLPDIMQRGQNALESPCVPPSTLLQLIHEIRSLHAEYQPVLTELRERFCGPGGNMASFAQDSADLSPILVAHFSRTYGLGLMVGIIMNSILNALDHESLHLRQDSSQMADEILQLAEFSRQYRPLGAMYMTICLRAAWMGAIEPETKAEIRAVLLDYHKDLQGSRAHVSITELEWLVERFNLTRPEPLDMCHVSVEVEGENRWSSTQA